MKIKSISTHVMGVPGPGGHSPSRNWIFVRIDTDTGITGVGEATTEYHEQAVAAMIQLHFAPVLLGQDPTRVNYLWQQMRRRFWWRNGVVETSALSGIEQALWDIAGKSAGVPVHALLGPARNEVARLLPEVAPRTDDAPLRLEFDRAGQMRLFEALLPKVTAKIGHASPPYTGLVMFTGDSIVTNYSTFTHPFNGGVGDTGATNTAAPNLIRKEQTSCQKKCFPGRPADRSCLSGPLSRRDGQGALLSRQFLFEIHDLLELGKEPAVDFGDLEDLFDAEPSAQGVTAHRRIILPLDPGLQSGRYVSAEAGHSFRETATMMGASAAHAECRPE
jgi:hypothetical protein